MANVVNMENSENAVVAKNPVNVLDLLLGGDVGKIKTPFMDVEITRLSEAFGVPFVVRCEALSPDKYEELQEISVNIQGKDVDMDVNAFQKLTVIEGVKTTAVDEAGNCVVGGLLLKNKELMDKFKAHTPKDLCNMIFLSGEVVSLYQTISELSGFSEEAVKKVKN